MTIQLEITANGPYGANVEVYDGETFLCASTGALKDALEIAAKRIAAHWDYSNHEQAA